MDRLLTAPPAQAFLDRHLACVEPAVAFLQGRDPSLAMGIAGRQFLPKGPRFEPLDIYYDPEGGDPLAWAFGAWGPGPGPPPGHPLSG